MFLYKSSVPEYGDYKLREATMNVNASGSSFGDNATGGLQPLSAVVKGQFTLALLRCHNQKKLLINEDNLYIVHDSGDSILGLGSSLT